MTIHRSSRTANLTGVTDAVAQRSTDYWLAKCPAIREAVNVGLGKFEAASNGPHCQTKAVANDTNCSHPLATASSC